MPGRRKIFDWESRQARYAAAGINEKLIFNLRDIHCTMRALYEGKGSVARVLIMLNKTGPIAQKDLTDLLEIQPASVSDVLAKMDAQGLIQRRPSESDQRTWNVSLTQEGEQKALEAAAQRLRRHEEMFSCLDEDRKAQLLSLLEAINGDLEKRYRQTETAQ